MSEVDNTLIPTDENMQIDERESLKSRLTLMGISFQNNAHTAKLRELLESAAEASQFEPHKTDEPAAKTNKAVVLDATKLVRVTILSNDPLKKEYQGEMFTVGNAVIGTIRKYIPFGRMWLVPQILVNVLEEKEMQLFETVNLSNGGTTRVPRTIKAYNIIRHALPTKEEIEELAKAQGLRGGL